MDGSLSINCLHFSFKKRVFEFSRCGNRVGVLSVASWKAPMQSRSDAAAAANCCDCCEQPPEAEPPLWVQETAERENVRLRRDLSYYRSEAFRLEKALSEVNAALELKQGAVSYMDRQSSIFRGEWPKLRTMLKRWDERNWADLCVYALRGGVIDAAAEMDYTHDITD